MNRAVRTVWIFCAAVLLVGCGWHPLYNTQNRTADHLGAVWIDTIPSADGIRFRNTLSQLFYVNGVPDNPLYVLKVSLSSRSRSTGIKSDDTATRAQINIKASYTLYDRETLTPLHKGVAQIVTAYNILDNQFTTTVSRDDAYGNGLKTLAEKVHAHLSLYFDSLQRDDVP